ncbi:MAG: hypothetical protein ACPGU1_17130 [Myxococcota bacterium]
MPRIFTIIATFAMLVLPPPTHWSPPAAPRHAAALQVADATADIGTAVRPRVRRDRVTREIRQQRRARHARRK